MSGLIPLVDKAISLRISGNTIKAPTASARMAKIHFNELIIFDDESVPPAKAMCRHLRRHLKTNGTIPKTLPEG